MLTTDFVGRDICESFLETGTPSQPILPSHTRSGPVKKTGRVDQVLYTHIRIYVTYTSNRI